MNVLTDRIKEIFANPLYPIVILTLFLLFLGFMKIRKTKITTRVMTQIAMSLAIAVILSFFKFIQMPQSGSVTPGDMVPILLIAIIYGPEIGLLTGFTFGIITLIIEPSIVHPIQLLLDYPLAFMALGLAGYFKRNKYFAVTVGIFGRFLCHFISGVVFFGSYAPVGQSVYLYSLIYNGFYLSIDFIICMVIIGLLPIKRFENLLKK
ncbi:MAG TPA: energy-coupled thiamine transporter ThiT [Clostridiaceae bacterium]